MHESDVIDAPAQDCETIESHAECKALIFLWVDIGIFEHVRMDHSGTHHFNPLSVELLGHKRAADPRIDLYSGLDERKVAGTKSCLDIGTLEQPAIKLLDGSLEIC